MSTTPKGFPYPAAGDPPDGPGAFYALASALDATTATWTPALGGGGGEALGSGGTVIGHSFQLANQVILTGRFAFGSSPALGTNPTLLGLPYNLIQATATGSGYFLHPGSTPVPVLLVPTSTSQLAIFTTTPVTVSASDTIAFRIVGIKA